MKIGLGIGVTKPQGMPVGLSQSPAGLFTAGEQGAWYDPSDINLTWRRNLLTYTEQFDNAAWAKMNASVLSNVAIAPDGTLNADKFVPNSAYIQHYFRPTDGSSTAQNTTGTFSLYAKPAGLTTLAITAAGGTGHRADFNLSTGTVSYSVGGTATITSVGNGWFRCTLTAAPGFNFVPYVFAGTYTDYTGDGTSGIYIWGAQLEQGSTATPYQRITDGVQDYLQYQAQPILYQDATGTTPVTAVEQPVGLMLDKSKGLVLGTNVCTTTYPITASASGAIVARMGTVTAGTWYKLTYTVTASTLGNGGVLYFEPAGGPFAYQTIPSTVGTHTVYAYASDAELTYAGISLGGGPGITGSITLSSCTIQTIPGNHAFQSTSANRPTLSARYNLLTKTEQFDDAVWAFANVGTGTGTKTANYGIAPDGTQTAARVQLSVGVLTDRAYFYQGIAAPASATQRWYIKTNDGSTKTITMAGVGTKQIIVTGSWQLFTSSDSAVAGANPGLILGNSTPTDLSADLLVWHPDVRVSNDALNQPAYQRVNTSTDYDTVGFRPYLAFNGTSSSMQTNSIDFTYGDKMFVAAGVRKLSDANPAILVELSAVVDSNNGSFFIAAPGDIAAAEYRWRVRGTAQTNAIATTFVAPITNTLTGLGDISGDSAVLRINGTQAASSTADQGTGNFGNYPLYIGARAGSSLWFNGRLYGMVIRGAETNSTDIYKTEDYLNTKTRAYFPNTLFLESGENLLQEDGSYIILES